LSRKPRRRRFALPANPTARLEVLFRVLGQVDVSPIKWLEPQRGRFLNVVTVPVIDG